MKHLPGGKKALLAVIGFVVFFLLGYRLFWYRPPMPVIAVKKNEIQGKVYGPGTVQSKVPVAVSTKITGILEKLYVDQGDRVKKGQLLAELDVAELKARVAAARAAMSRVQRDMGRARADVAKALASLALAQSNYRRDLELVKDGYISEAAFDTTKAALKVAESEEAAARAAAAALEAEHAQAASELEVTEAALGYTRIVAPMDGLITLRKAEIGNTVSPGSPIFQMVDLDQIWVAAWIDETQIAQLGEGQKASIKLRSGRVFQGKVARLNRAADTVTRELEVDVKFHSQPEPLVIGEEAEVEIATRRQTAPAVPLSAIISRNGQPGVMVVEGGQLSFRKVSLGVQDGKKAAVLAGLQEGDLIVLNPAGAEVGKKVRPQLKNGELLGD